MRWGAVRSPPPATYRCRLVKKQPGRRSSAFDRRRCFLRPTGPVILPLDALAGRKNIDGIQPVQHHRVLVGVSLLSLIGQGFRMRSMMNAARMQRGHTGLDIVFAEEVAVVIEDEFVVVGIAVEERHSQRVRFLFERPRHETAYDGAGGYESGVGARRQMRAMAHHRPYIANVDFPNREVRSEEHTS